MNEIELKAVKYIAIAIMVMVSIGAIASVLPKMNTPIIQINHCECVSK